MGLAYRRAPSRPEVRAGAVRGCAALAHGSVQRDNQDMRALIAVIIAAVIGFFVYRAYFAQVQPEGPGTTATQAISLTGVKNDLLAIAQAERAYQAEHGSYATFDELISSNTLRMAKPERDGYVYTVEASAGSFSVTARHPASAQVRWPTLVIDQSMQVRQSD